MSPEPQHACPAAGRSTTIAAAWAILIFLGGTQVTFNVVSALRHSTLNPVPVLAGIMPVLASVMLSHLAAFRRAETWFRIAITLVMICSMAVSIGATVAVTAPVFGTWWRAVLFGIMLDAASLLALWFIMDRHGEKAAVATALETAHATAREATGKAAALEAELATAGTRLADALRHWRRNERRFRPGSRGAVPPGSRPGTRLPLPPGTGTALPSRNQGPAPTSTPRRRPWTSWLRSQTSPGRSWDYGSANLTATVAT
jgi:hypothetical protein